MKFLDPHIHLFYSVTTVVAVALYVIIRFQLVKPMKRGTLQEQKMAERVALAILLFNLIQLFRVLFLKD